MVCRRRTVGAVRCPVCSVQGGGGRVNDGAGERHGHGRAGETDDSAAGVQACHRYQPEDSRIKMMGYRGTCGAGRRAYVARRGRAPREWMGELDCRCGCRRAGGGALQSPGAEGRKTNRRAGLAPWGSAFRTTASACSHTTTPSYHAAAAAAC